MANCSACGGVLGRDCFNEQECALHFRMMQNETQTCDDIDVEAIAWDYSKLIAYGVQNTSMENALMIDRLNLMLMHNDLFVTTP